MKTLLQIFWWWAHRWFYVSAEVAMHDYMQYKPPLPLPGSETAMRYHTAIDNMCYCLDKFYQYGGVQTPEMFHSVTGMWPGRIHLPEVR